MSFWISSILGKSAMGNKKQKVHENESGSHAPLHLSNLFFVYGSIIARHPSLLLKKSDILKPFFFFFCCRKIEKECIGNFIFESLVGSLESAGLFCVSGEKRKKLVQKNQKIGKMMRDGGHPSTTEKRYRVFRMMV